jgi:hypothetical protein
MSFKITARLLKDVSAKTYSDLKNQIAALKTTEVKVGLPGEKLHKAPKGSKAKSTISVAMVGAVHEFGAPDRGIPERPWLRPGIRSGQQSYIRLNRINIIKILRGHLSPMVALRQLGAMAQGFVQKYIRSGNFTPLKPATIARKGSSAPLIDTAQMIQSVTFEVAQKEKS